MPASCATATSTSSGAAHEQILLEPLSTRGDGNDNHDDVRDVLPSEKQGPVPSPSYSSSPSPAATTTPSTGATTGKSNFKRQTSSGSLHSCSARSAASSNSLKTFLGTLISDTASVVIVEDNAGRTREQHIRVSQSFRSLHQQPGRSRSCRWSSSSSSALPIARRSSDFGGFVVGGGAGGGGNARWDKTVTRNNCVPLTVDAVSSMSTSPPSDAVMEIDESFPSPGTRTGTVSSTSFSSRSASSSNSLLRDMLPAQPIRKHHTDDLAPPSAAQMNRQGSNISTLSVSMSMSMSDHGINSNSNSGLSDNDSPVLLFGATAAITGTGPRNSTTDPSAATGRRTIHRQSSMDTMPRIPQRRSPLAAAALSEAEDLLEDSGESFTEGGNNSNGDTKNTKKDYNQSGGVDAFITRSLTRSGSGDSCSSHSKARRLESVLGSMAPGKDRQQVRTTSGGSKQRRRKSSSSSSTSPRK